MTIKQAVDQVQVARPAGSGAHRQFPGELGLGPGGERGDLLMTGGHPLDGAHPVQAVAQTVEGIPGDTPDPFHSGLFQHFRDVVRHGLFHGSPSPECDNAFKLR